MVSSIEIFMSRTFLVVALVLAFGLGSRAEDAPAITADELAAVKAAEAERIQAIESVYGAVVAIYGNDRQGGGSGVLFDPAGYALTNHHVVGAGGTEGWAGLADGKLYRWKLIGTDPGGDVAIIRLMGKEAFPAAPLGDSERVRVGDWAMAMGNPFVLAEDQRPTVTLGIVSGIERYQEGSGLNQLVYGNCIQVDSSINPGNSGGPLFNIRGEIIGINGRGSFEERGRVNVGLGYAISSAQIKRFIPELLATKIAQHGTLDAIFGNREDGVICHTLNLDAPAARAGLALGDKLVAFEGIAIDNANQFTNLITTFPAGWPVELTFEREGERQTIHVRLTPLPYEPRVKPTEKQPEKPEEKPGEDKPHPEKPGIEKPSAEKPAAEKPGDKSEEKSEQPPVPKVKPVEPPLELGDAGKIRDKSVNRHVAQRILARWQETAGTKSLDEAIKGLRLTSEIRRGEAVVGRQVLTIARDGRLRAEYEVDGRRTVVVGNGSSFWLFSPGREVQSVSQAKALRDPHFSQAAVLSSLLAEEPLARWGDLALEGADKAQRRLCYRLSSTDATSEQLFVWLSVANEQGSPHVEIVKSGVGIDDEEPIPSTCYSDFRPIQGLLIPQRRALVRSLAESEDLVVVTIQCEPLADFSADLFQRPME